MAWRFFPDMDVTLNRGKLKWISINLKWRDQGWGNSKCRFGICLMRNEKKVTNENIMTQDKDDKDNEEGKEGLTRISFVCKS